MQLRYNIYNQTSQQLQMHVQSARTHTRLHADTARNGAVEEGRSKAHDYRFGLYVLCYRTYQHPRTYPRR